MTCFNTYLGKGEFRGVVVSSSELNSGISRRKRLDLPSHVGFPPAIRLVTHMATCAFNTPTQSLADGAARPIAQKVCPWLCKRLLRPLAGLTSRLEPLRIKLLRHLQYVRKNNLNADAVFFWHPLPAAPPIAPAAFFRCPLPAAPPMAPAALFGRPLPAAPPMVPAALFGSPLPAAPPMAPAARFTAPLALAPLLAPASRFACPPAAAPPFACTFI